MRKLFGGLILAAALAGSPAIAATPADTLVIAKNIDDIITLDPAETFELSGGEVVKNVYDQLMGYELEDIKKLVPAAAESYTISDDGKTVSLTITENLAPSFVLNCLTAGVASIVDKKVALEHQANGDFGHEWLKTHDAGSGPYALRSWEPI